MTTEQNLAQSNQKVILVYGTSQAEKANKSTKLNIVDVTEPGWEKSFEPIIELEGVEGITFFCTSETFIIAKKFFPLSSFVRLNSLEEILQQTNKPAAPRAMFAKIEDIVVSNNHCQAIEDSKAWLSSYHLELIEKLFKDDFKIEICDEANNVILTLERKKNGTES